MKCLLDSTVIIDLLLNRSEAVRWFNQVKLKDINICPVNYGEVLTGCHDSSDWDKARLLMDSMHILNFELSDFIAAARMRQLYHFKLPDALLASLAIRYNLVFITRNTKDFNPSIHKFVKVPYKLH